MITVNFNSSEHLYLQIVHEIINQIALGHLKSGDKLPSRRSLAEHLDVSLNTVINAYDQLLDEGYLVARERSGYYIDLLAPDMIPASEPLKEEPPKKIRTADKQKNYAYDFYFANRDMQSINSNSLLQFAPQALEKSIANCNKREPLGILPLRQAIAHYLRKYRGVYTHAENIIITTGHSESLFILFSLLDHSSYAVEDPGYYQSLDTFTKFNQQAIKIPIDKYGFSVKDLEKTKANTVITTPNHQFPTGIIMGMRRRQRLLKWAYQEPDRYIIENDYYNEFRLKGRSIPALTSLDQKERVILLGAFRQTLGSIFRMSYLVLPDHLIGKFHEQPINLSSISSFEQFLMSDFLESEAFPKYINSLRTNYRRKEKAVIQALKQSSLPIKIHEAGGGLFFIISFEGPLPAEAVIQARLNEANINLQSVNQYASLAKQFKNSYILGYGGLELNEIAPAIQALLKVFE